MLMQTRGGVVPVDDLSYAEQRLVAWGRWMWLPDPDDQIGPRTPSCRSAENAYRSPQHWEADPIPLEQPNSVDAMAVEKIVSAMPPWLEQKCLRCWYVERDLRVVPFGLTPGDAVPWSAHFCGVGERTFEQRLQVGRLYVRDNLRPLAAAA